MAITNGFNDTVVLPAMLGRLGWLNPTEAGYDIVDGTNSQSASGRYFNGGAFHSACTIQNLYDCQDDPKISDANFNSLLTRLKQEVILSGLNMVFDKPQYIESGLLFDKCANATLNLIQNSNKFCGVQLKVAKGDYAIQLQNAVLLFDAAATFKLYLYNDLFGKVQDWEVTVEANKPKVLALNTVVNYLNPTQKGGTYYLGYFQNDLSGAKAIDYRADRKCFKAVGAQSFEARRTGTETFDSTQVSTTWNVYGLNVELSVYRDLTNTITGNAQLFDELQGLMMASKVIEVMLNSTRANSTERIGKENLGLLYRELNNVTTQENPSSPGLKARINSEIKRVRQAFQPKSKTTIVSIA